MATIESYNISRTEFEVLQNSVRELHDDIRDIRKVYNSINEQAIVTKELATEIKFMRESQTKMDERLTNLENVPKTKYNSLIGAIINAIVVTIIGAIAVIIGLKK